MSENSKKKCYLKRFFLHLHTVDTHRYQVMKNCFKCGLYKQGLKHDLSKYSFTEFFESVKYFQGDRSPYAYEKELFGFAKGWMHHKGHNPHHWEYWYDLQDGKWQPLEMPYNYLVEMVCDRVAACKIYEKENYTDASALNYLMSGKDRFAMNYHTAQMLKMILQDISNQGEEAVFKQLKENIKVFRKQEKTKHKQMKIAFKKER